MPRPIHAEVSLAALRHNLARARKAAGGRALWAVVKADAYGHGLAQVLPGLDAADALALIDLQDAVRARELGWERRIVLLEGIFDASDAATAHRLDLTVAIHHPDQLELIAACGPVPEPRPLDLLLKVDTGMSRLGFAPARLAAARERALALAGTRLIGLMTHLANADSHGTPMDVEAQLARLAEARGDWPGPVTIANSAALLLREDVGGFAVRPGIALYGASPGGMAAAELGLRAVMTLRSRVLAVQSVPTGTPVGYGSRWRARRPSRIGVVACGYADGYPRHAPDGTPVRVAGVRVPLAGRVSMDLLCVDLTDAPQAGVGDEVELWGEGLPVDEVAAAAGTIGYELLCARAPRVGVRVLD